MLRLSYFMPCRRTIPSGAARILAKQNGCWAGSRRWRWTRDCKKHCNISNKSIRSRIERRAQLRAAEAGILEAKRPHTLRREQLPAIKHHFSRHQFTGALPIDL